MNLASVALPAVHHSKGCQRIRPDVPLTVNFPTWQCLPVPCAASWPAVFLPHCLCDLETFITRLPLREGQPPQSDRHRRPLGRRRPSPTPRGVNKLYVRKIIQRIDIKLTPQLSGSECAKYLQAVGMNN